MKTILYIGNNLKSKKSNISSIGVLGPLLESDSRQLFYASSYNNKIRRILDMLYSCVKHKNRIDYVIIDTYSTLNFYYAFLVSQLCRILKVNYIPILHGGNLEKRLIQNPKLSKMVFDNAYKLVSPSNFLKVTFKNYGYQNVEYIPNTIEVSDFEFFNRDVEIIKLFWLRSFSKIYNPSLAVLILDSLIKKGYNAELCMVGPDSDGSLKEVKQLVKQLDLSVKFTGKLSKKEWIELSKNYNIFINTTNFDNTPVSVIEAMALGLPVVSTEVGGLPYLISHNEDGLLVPPNDVDAMVNAIIKLQEDQNLKNKLVFNARKKVEKFDWKEVKVKWEKLLS